MWPDEGVIIEWTVAESAVSHEEFKGRGFSVEEEDEE